MAPRPSPGKTPRAVWNALSEQRVFYSAGRFAMGIDGRSGSGKSTLARDMAAEFAEHGYGARIVQLDQLCPGWHGLDRAVDLALRWILQPLAVRRKPGDAGPASSDDVRRIPGDAGPASSDDVRRKPGDAVPANSGLPGAATAGYWRWDWHESRYADWVSVAPPMPSPGKTPRAVQPAPSSRRDPDGEARFTAEAAPEAPFVLIIEGCGIGSARARELLDVLVWVETPEPVRRRRALVRERDFLRYGGSSDPEAPAGADPLWWWAIWAAQEDAILARERIRSHADIVVDG